MLHQCFLSISDCANTNEPSQNLDTLMQICTDILDPKMLRSEPYSANDCLLLARNFDELSLEFCLNDPLYDFPLRLDYRQKLTLYISLVNIIRDHLYKQGYLSNELKNWDYSDIAALEKLVENLDFLGDRAVEDLAIYCPTLDEANILKTEWLSKISKVKSIISEIRSEATINSQGFVEINNKETIVLDEFISGFIKYIHNGYEKLEDFQELEHKSITEQIIKFGNSSIGSDSERAMALMFTKSITEKGIESRFKIQPKGIYRYKNSMLKRVGEQLFELRKK